MFHLKKWNNLKNPYTHLNVIGISRKYQNNDITKNKQRKVKQKISKFTKQINHYKIKIILTM